MVPRFLAPLIAALLLLPATAFAERYRVDLIVFLDRGGYSTEAPRAYRLPDLSRALELNSPALTRAGIQLLDEASFGLNTEWQKLRTSRRYQPLIKLAWLQSDPPTDRTFPLHIRGGIPLPIPQQAPMPPRPTTNVPTLAPMSLDGTIALRLSRYLYLDADLAYTQPAADGNLSSYRLKEVRRLRRDELHYMDSPRLGIVTRVQKAPAS
jgi:hypothetical protein